jgi:ubiquinone/menaquinone biosynthesis C-methylase UbiE
MSAPNETIQKLLEANPLREPLLGSIIQSIGLPLSSHGLDVGCGIGLQAMLLAEAVGPGGHITGLDIDHELLAYGDQSFIESGYPDRIDSCQGDATGLPYAAQTFDWAWSADCIGYPAGALSRSLKELVRVVRPGGWIVLLGWSAQQLLPGYPLVEAQLNATCSAYIPYFTGMNPELNFLRATRSFKAARLEEVRGQTFAGDIQAPLSSAERTALLSLFTMLWGQPQQIGGLLPLVSPENDKNGRLISIYQRDHPAYAAHLGRDGNSLARSPGRRCCKPLKESRVALLSSAGIALKTDTPFDQEGERQNPWWGDPSYRLIPNTAVETDVRLYHMHIDPRPAQQDLNCLFPLRGSMNWRVWEKLARLHKPALFHDGVYP